MKKSISYFTLLAAAGIPSALHAQTGSPIIVEDVPIEESILPTTRPISTVYGLEKSITDIPRNVTIISREQLDAITIRDVRDFSKLTSSSYTQSNFGAPSNPSIRGLSADVFVNGMRKGLTSNGNGMPVNFNAVESVNIVKGPPSVIQGVSAYVGGYVDYVTKRPYFDRLQGEVSVTVGDYDIYRWQADVGGPLIADKLAFRLSYSGEESKGYYEDGRKETQAIYAAITWTPTDKYTLDWNAEFYNAEYTENFGVNRPTQDFIDNGTYITGFVGDVNGDGVADNRDVNGGFNFVIPTGTTRLSDRARLLRPGDGSQGKNFNTQVIQTFKINDNATLVNNTFFNYVDRNTLSSYYYSEILKENFSIENRTELRLNFDIPLGSGAVSKTIGDKGKEIVTTSDPAKIGNQINLGVAVRYQEVNAYNDFFNEPAQAWDLSRPRNLINYVNQAAGGSVDVSGLTGFPGRFATPGVFNGDTNESSAWTISPFFLHNIDFTDKFSFLYGGRLDILSVDATDPVGALIGLPGTSDSYTAYIPNYSASLSYKITPKITAYATYNYSESTGVANGGGYMTDTGTVDFNYNYFHRKSELFEVGLKGSFLKDTLFIGLAGFSQTRNVPTQGGATNKLDVKGFEIEANYQPNRNFYFTVSYSYLDSVLKNQRPFAVTGSPFDKVGANGYPGNLTPNFSLPPDYPVGDYRQPGVPMHLINALVSYRHPCGFHATLGTVITAEMNNNYDDPSVANDELKIPWQYSIDASVGYTYKNFDVKVSVNNVTDERNFSPPNSIYANDSIVIDPGRMVEGTFTWKF